MPDPLSWILIGILLFLSFFFSASETALACCNRFKMQVRADEGNRSAKLVLKVTNHYNRALTAVLIGNNIAAIVMSSIATLLFIKMFSDSGMQQYASIISSVILTFVVYLLGDALPKTIAKAIPDTFSLVIIYPTYFIIILLYPITLVFEGIGHLINKIFKQKNDESFTEEDFEDAVEQVSEDEVIEEEQKEIIQSTLDFVDTKVKEVFTPIERMYALDIKELTHEKIKELLPKIRYSRIPIYRDNYDTFVGILHIKTYLSKYQKDSNISVKSTLTKPYYVSQNVMLDDLFNGFKRHHTHIALVVNSQHRVIGMVTMEDILEEIVSDIGEPINQRGGKK